MDKLVKLGKDFKIDIICDVIHVFKADVYKCKNNVLQIQVEDYKFNIKNYANITLNLRGNGYNYITNKVELRDVKKSLGVYEVSKFELINNNMREYRRVDVNIECVLDQLGREYSVIMQNVSVGGAKVILKKSICVLGLFRLKFILIDGEKFNLEAKIVGYHVADNNQNICLRLQFLDMSKEDTNRLGKSINELELDFIKRARGTK